MYERFTDRARSAFRIANREAIRLNCEYISSEHILLGLIEEGSGIAAQVLKDIDLLEVERKIRNFSGLGVKVSGKLPQTPRSKKIVERALEYARERNDNFLGTFHILIGIMREGNSIAYKILNDLKFSEEFFINAESELISEEKAPEGLELQIEKAVIDMDFEKAASIRDAIVKYKTQIEIDQKE